VILSPRVSALIDGLTSLPGVGPKSAQRMALQLLERDREGGERLANALTAAMRDVRHCEECRNFCETAVCALCESDRRDRSQLCVVETPTDLLAIDAGAGYQGLYFILMGRLSPLDGIGPEDIGLDRLSERLASGEIRELILAINPTIEGEVTANYISDLAAEQNIKVTRIACGVPMGGELGYVDQGTLAHAFAQRA